MLFTCVSDLVVASPVEDYFLYIDDLPYPEKVRLQFFFLTKTKEKNVCSRKFLLPLILFSMTEKG